MSEFDGISGFEGWKRKLSELLQEAEVPDLDVDQRIALSNRFSDFIIHSRPNTSDILRLDRIAEEAREAMLLTSIDERLAAINARTADLARLTKELRLHSAEAASAARSLRLERAEEAVDALTATIRTLQNLHVDQEAGSNLNTALEQLVSSMQEMRVEIENSSQEARVEIAGSPT